MIEARRGPRSVLKVLAIEYAGTNPKWFVKVANSLSNAELE